LSPDKTQIVQYYVKEIHDLSCDSVDVNVTLKNVYNYCKNFVHYNTNDSDNNDNNEDENPKFVKMSYCWENLTKAQKGMISARINGKDKNWFRIPGYIKRFICKNKDQIDVINKKLAFESQTVDRSS
jgi:hypothetical protein